MDEISGGAKSKSAKKLVKKPAKKLVKKPVRKSVKKLVKKPAKKSVGGLMKKKSLIKKSAPRPSSKKSASRPSSKKSTKSSTARKVGGTRKVTPMSELQKEAKKLHITLSRGGVKRDRTSLLRAIAYRT